jgi:hypothetical protein
MFIHTETNGLHNTYKPVSKKYIFDFARLISLKYSIGTFNYKENGEINKFNEEKKEKYIFTPKCITFDKKAEEIHGITFDKAVKKGKDNYHIMRQFQKDLYKIDIIIGCNLDFHIKAIQVELFRTCTNIDFSQFVLVDTSKFNKNNDYISLEKISEKYNITSSSKLKLIKKLFPLLYNDSLAYSS